MQSDDVNDSSPKLPRFPYFTRVKNIRFTTRTIYDELSNFISFIWLIFIF